MFTLLPQRFTLRWTLVVYIIVPLIVSLALTGYLSLGFIERQVEKRLQNDLELVSRAIQLPLSHALEKQRPGSVASALQSVFSIDSVFSAYVYDTGGRRIASAGQRNPELKRRKLTELATDGEHIGEYGTVGERGVYSYYLPLTDSAGEVSGLLHLTRRQSDFQHDIETIRRQGIIWLSIGALVMTGLVLFGHHQALGRHFRLLTAGMAQITGGRRNYRMPPAGPREMVEVIISFNDMLDSIEQTEQALHRQRLEQLELEKQLRHKEKLAAIGQLAAGVAHELGTPLSVITGYAQRGLRTSNLEPRLADNLTHIRDEVSKMSYIVRQLLEFSSHEELRYATVRPEQILQGAVASVQPEAKRLGATVQVEKNRDLPVIKADPARLEQAVVNLLRNAIQVGQRPLVRLSCRLEEGRICYRVEDNGPGISDSIRPRLFEPFFTTKSVGAGTGLGLAVVHGIVQEHGGSIAVEKSELGGASFCISLQLQSEK